jgi:Fic family protein
VPTLELRGSLGARLSRADLALGRLDGVCSTLPNPDLFVSMYVRREAVLSSQIEGTQASLADVLRFEAGGEERFADVSEVVNYVAAMNHGLERLERVPLSLPLIREIHARLMSGSRVEHAAPGEFRALQNWVGPRGCTPATASYVPPPPDAMHDALRDLEGFLHEESQPALVHAALAHAQFETIHPFLDGNGRVGRLLITYLLCHRRVLARPLLYLSHYLKRHRQEYYDRLQAIRDGGRWEEWLGFFLRGVEEVATEATATARQILALQRDHAARLHGEGKTAGSLLRLLDYLFEHPICSARMVERDLGVTFATATKLIGRLTDLGLVEELTGGKRNRRFRFTAYLRLIDDQASAAD